MDKELLVAEVPESRDNVNDSNSEIIVGVPKDKKKPVQKQKPNRRRQFKKGNIIKIKGVAYKIVEIVDQPQLAKQSQRQRQRKPNNQQLARRRKIQQQRRLQQQQRKQQQLISKNTNEKQ